MLARIASCALLAVAAGCTNVRTEGDPLFAVAPGAAYAWRSAPLAGDAPPGGDPLPLAAVRRAVDAALAAEGFTVVPLGEAELLVEATLAVEERVQLNDPYYAVYTSERYEEGVLVVELFPAGSAAPAWRAEVRDRLRYTARSLGGLIPREAPTGEAREWHLDDMAARIAARVPRR